MRSRFGLGFEAVVTGAVLVLGASISPDAPAEEVRAAIPVAPAPDAAADASPKRFSLFSIFKRRPAPEVEAAADAAPAKDRPDRPADGQDGSDTADGERLNSENHKGLARFLPFLRQSSPRPQEDAEPEPDDPPAAAPSRSTRADKFIVTENGVKFYRDGPLQLQPPEHVLSEGDFVSLVVWRKTWCDVRLGSGEIGVIPTDQMRKAKASDFPVEPLVIDRLESLDKLAHSPVFDDVPLLEPVPPPPLPEAVTDGTDPGDVGLSPMLLPPLVQ